MGDIDGKYRKLAHTTYDCRYHVVFIPKYRHRLLQGDVATFVQRVFEEVCMWKEIVLLSGSIRPDHVHLYRSIPPKYSVSDALKWLNGKSATRILQRFPHINEQCWGGHFWARGYFVSTIGISDAIIRQYIEKQEEQERIEENLTKQQRLWD